VRALLFLTALALLGACDTAGSSVDGSDAGVDAGVDTGMDAGVDAGTSAGMDAGIPDAAAADAGAVDRDATPPSSDAAEGAPCTFNRECAATQRCECDEATGCFCRTGPRGTGLVGDPCTDGNDCASSVCVEGPDGAFYCSDECTEGSECSAPLPRCIDVAFLGRICARVPPDAG
jgi:hypothetical protein